MDLRLLLEGRQSEKTTINQPSILGEKMGTLGFNDMVFCMIR